jgi:hypothetical protein
VASARNHTRPPVVSQSITRTMAARFPGDEHTRCVDPTGDEARPVELELPTCVHQKHHHYVYV